VKISGLVELENQLKGLWSPQWPAAFPPINQAAGFPKFNVNDSNGNPIIGNSNAGHEGDQYGTSLSPDQRRQLIEYLKSL